MSSGNQGQRTRKPIRPACDRAQRGIGSEDRDRTDRDSETRQEPSVSRYLSVGPFYHSSTEDPEFRIEALLTAVAADNERAFEELYGAVFATLSRLSRRVVRDPLHAEEVVHESLLEIWLTATRYQPEQGRALSWMSTITHRRAIDRVRSTQTATARDAKVATRQTSGRFDETAEPVLTRCEHEQTRQCLATLTELQRKTVSMAYYDGHAPRELAALLDAPLSTVKTRIRDGLARLRRCLEAGSFG